MKKNYLSQFATRILMVIIATSALVITGAYLYYKQLAQKELQEIFAQGKATIEAHFGRSFNDLNSTQDLAPILKEYIRSTNIYAVRVINKNNENVLRSEIDASMPFKILEKFNEDFYFDDQVKNYSLEDFQGNLYLFYETFFQEAKFRTIIKIPRAEILDIETTLKNAILLVVLTAFLVGAITFPIVLSQYKELKKSSQELLLANIDTLFALGNAIAKRDSDTHEHNYRVTYYAVKIAEKMKLKKERIQDLIRGAFLHDVGKIGISDTILLKPGKLTKGEFEHMKEHVNYGLEIVASVPWLKSAKKVIGSHHEKYDGSGYPNALSKEDIPLEARIFAVADVFDALTSQRPYKKPYSIEESLEIMDRESGSHFDPDIMKVFETIVDELYLEVHNKKTKEYFDEILKPYF